MEKNAVTRQHYEKNEAGAGLLSKLTKILDSLPDGSVDSWQLAGLDQFHVMGLAATEQLAQIRTCSFCYECLHSGRCTELSGQRGATNSSNLKRNE